MSHRIAAVLVGAGFPLARSSAAAPASLYGERLLVSGVSRDHGLTRAEDRAGAEASMPGLDLPSSTPR